jgi:predicted DNA-binding protein
MEQVQKGDKRAMSIRLSAEGRRLLDALSARLGISRTAVLELIIRETAERKGIE